MGRGAGLGTDSGVPGSGGQEQGLAARVLACMCTCCPGAPASSVPLLLHFMQVRRGALSFAPGTNCAVCASLTLLAPTYASAKQGNYSDLLTSGLREHCWYSGGTGPQEWPEAKKRVLGLGWTCGGHSPRMATSSLIIGDPIPNVGLLLRRCSGKGLHLAMTGEPRGFSRVTAGFSSYDGEFRKGLVPPQRVWLS